MAAPLPGSELARRYTAGIIPVLTGARTTADAWEMMGVSLPRYYQLETQGILGMVAGLEPKAKGRQRTAAHKELTKENARLTREVSRLQSQVRMSRHALGIPEPKPKKAKGSKPTRRPKRGRRAVARLVRPGEDEKPKTAGGAG